jgi:hypothetical protein
LLIAVVVHALLIRGRSTVSTAVRDGAVRHGDRIVGRAGRRVVQPQRVRPRCGPRACSALCAGISSPGPNGYERLDRQDNGCPASIAVL